MLQSTVCDRTASSAVPQVFDGDIQLPQRYRMSIPDPPSKEAAVPLNLWQGSYRTSQAVFQDLAGPFMEFSMTFHDLVWRVEVLVS